MSKPDPQSSSSSKKPWAKPALKVIAAGSAEADISQDVKDGANSSAKS